MRARLVVAGLLLLAIAAASAASAAGPPMTLVLASAHGRGSVALGTDTGRLHGRIWLYRTGGVGTATGRATVSCRTKPTAAGVGGLETWFRLSLPPGSRREVWRYGGDACTISVSLTGRGQLSVALRGY